MILPGARASIGIVFEVRTTRWKKPWWW